MTYKLLIVDDEMPNLRLLERLFRNDYYCLTASSGQDAIKLLEQHDVATIITDQRMPLMTGIELLKRTAELRPHMVRILLTGYTDTEALVEAINCGLVYMYVTKPWNNDDLKLRVGRAIEHYVDNKKRTTLETGIERLTARLEQMKVALVRTLSEALKLRDRELFDHSTRVSEYAHRIARGLDLSESTCSDISSAALLHELGVLCNHASSPCRRTEEKGQSLRLLVASSADAANILRGVNEFTDIADMVRFQSESFDGSGFPRGLIGEQIPLGSRIIRLAAEYDLLLSPSAGTPLTRKDAIARLRERAAKELDSQLIEVLADLNRGDLTDPTVSLQDPTAVNLIVHSVN